MPKKYSAGAVKHGFWFEEFKIYIEKLYEGYTDSEIKELQNQENILLAPSVDYGKIMVNLSEKKIKSLPTDIINIFKEVDLYNQRLINFIAIMQSNLLLFELMNEVYRVHINMNNMYIENREYKVFMMNKAEDEPEVAKYTDITIKRLLSAFKTYMKEAQLVDNEDGDDKILKPIIDSDLKDVMISNKMDKYIRVLLGD